MVVDEVKSNRRPQRRQTAQHETNEKKKEKNRTNITR